jgi:hypothetical protein
MERGRGEGKKKSAFERGRFGFLIEVSIENRKCFVSFLYIFGKIYSFVCNSKISSIFAEI